MGFLDRLLNRPAPTAAGPNVASVGVSPRYLGGRETLEVVGEASYQKRTCRSTTRRFPGPWPGPEPVMRPARGMGRRQAGYALCALRLRQIREGGCTALGCPGYPPDLGRLGARAVSTIASPKSGLRRLTADTQRLGDLSPRVVGHPRLLDHPGQDRPSLDLDGRQSSDGNQGFLGDSQQVRRFGCCLAEVQRVDRVSITGTFGHKLRLLAIGGIEQEQILMRSIRSSYQQLALHHPIRQLRMRA